MQNNKQTPGLRLRKGIWHIEKHIRGYGPLYESTGTGDIEEAERFLRMRLEEIREARLYGKRPRRTFRLAATRYLEESTKVTLAKDAGQLKLLDPYIGGRYLEEVHDGTLVRFIEVRMGQGVKNRTINNGLEVVRRILRLCARWRDEHGLTWLAVPPPISTLPLIQEGREPPREGYPITWEEQTRLIAQLPMHLARLALFALNTGARDQEAVRLRWDEEIPLTSELPGGIFVLPRMRNKNRKVKRVLLLNSIARSVVDACRGDHPEYVFTYRGHEVKRVVNKAWMRAREAANLPGLRFHDLRHTYATRLRSLGVRGEDRADLLGHRAKDITGLYSDAEVVHLLEQAERLTEARSGKTPAMLMLRRVSNI